MEITLDVVRQLLRRALGFESFVATFITSVRAGDKVETAQIDAKGNLTYNPRFLTEKVRLQEDLFSLFMHELMHPLFNHYIYRADELTNIACDAVINATITALFPEQSCRGKLFERLYKAKSIEMILRPGCEDASDSRFARVYENLYSEEMPREERLTTGELIQSLKVLCEPMKAGTIPLLGSHGQAVREGETKARLPRDVLEKLAGELERVMSSSRLAGHGSALFHMLSDVLRTNLSVRRRLLKDFLTDRAVGKFLSQGRSTRRITSPVMLRPSKRDLVLLASGVWPALFHNRRYSEIRHTRGVAVYLDVSGSVNDELPETLGVLANMQSQIEKVFLFSNEVVETDLATLAKGELETTYGTDFDCVAASILERGYSKAIVITDGYSDMEEENAEKLKEKKVSILTIIFGDGDEECEALAPLGPVVKLEDAVR